LTIRYAGAILQYQFDVSGGNLTLTGIFNYGWDPSSMLPSIEEKQIISFTKQD
jgi:hypothetical protein